MFSISPIGAPLEPHDIDAVGATMNKRQRLKAHPVAPMAKGLRSLQPHRSYNCSVQQPQVTRTSFTSEEVHDQ